MFGPKPAPKSVCSVDECVRPTLGRGLCASHYSVWHRSQKRYTITCPECGEVAEVARKATRYCSRRCSAAAAGRASAEAHRRSTPREIEIYVPPKRPISVVHVRTKNRLTSGRCRVCNEWFVSEHRDVTCSSVCRSEYRRDRRRAGKDRRRARKRQAFVETVYRKKVFEADGYRCHLCGKKTDPSKAAPHPKAPTLDHIVPLADGGRHERTNCRTAHFLCNSRKGDRGGGEQLLLIA